MMPITLTPWTIGSEHQRDDDTTAYRDDLTGWPYFVREPQGEAHPHGMGYGGKHVAHGMQNLADAKLLTAAPDLLRELQGFVDRWSKYPKPPTGDDLRIYLDNARAVIAKATT
jgi:hypothetical protein